MTSKRDLKKEINYLVEEIITDCYIYKKLYPDKNQDKVDEIIGNTLNLRHDLIYRINLARNTEDKERKEYFRKIETDLMQHVEKSLDTLNKLTK